MHPTQVLADAIYWTAMITLVASFGGIMIAMISSDQRWSALLSGVDGRPPDLLRTGYLVGNIALAITFLLAVLKSHGDADGLKTATDLFNGLDMTALTGAASAAYAWSKLRSPGGPNG